MLGWSWHRDGWELLARLEQGLPIELRSADKPAEAPPPVPVRVSCVHQPVASCCVAGPIPRTTDGCALGGQVTIEFHRACQRGYSIAP